MFVLFALYSPSLRWPSTVMWHWCSVFIDKILNPLDCKERNAVSLPEPGPFTSTVSVLMPCSKAFAPASSQQLELHKV